MTKRLHPGSREEEVTTPFRAVPASAVPPAIASNVVGSLRLDRSRNSNQPMDFRFDPSQPLSTSGTADRRRGTGSDSIGKVSHSWGRFRLAWQHRRVRNISTFFSR